ncbi:MAG: hypothetical protein QG670_1924 [Thermoproteota archaeon]|nr:hypothetical protein [Thermoproteota archaeon]
MLDVSLSKKPAIILQSDESIIKKAKCRFKDLDGEIFLTDKKRLFLVAEEKGQLIQMIITPNEWLGLDKKVLEASNGTLNMYLRNDEGKKRKKLAIQFRKSNEAEDWMDTITL